MNVSPVKVAFLVLACCLFPMMMCGQTKADESNRCKHERRKEKVQQIKKRVADTWQVMDYTLQHRRPTTDTLYVTRPKQPWTIQARCDLKRTYFSTDDAYEGYHFKYYFQNDFNTSVGASVNYRGLSLSLSFSPKNVFTGIKDKEFNFNYYNNRFGVDLAYSNIKHFRGSRNFSNLFGGSSGKDNLGDTHLHSASLNAYYVFNYRRFSYPAAFNNTWIQKKSAGSLVAGTTVYIGKCSVDLSVMTPERVENLPLMADVVRMRYVSLNLGYAYNWVPNRHWLLHASAVPGLMIWKNYSADIAKLSTNPTTQEVTSEHYSTERWPKRFNDVVATLRFGATYTWENYFVGGTVVKQLEYIGDRDKATFYGGRWKIRFYFGLRL